MGRLSTVVEDPRLCCPDCGTDHTGHPHWYTVELTELTLEGRKKVMRKLKKIGKIRYHLRTSGSRLRHYRFLLL